MTLTDELERSHWSRNDRHEILQKMIFAKKLFFENKFSKNEDFYYKNKMATKPF